MNDQINVAYEALGSDATRWDSIATSINGAHTKVAGIDIYRGAFSFAGLDAGDVYLEAHAKVLTLLADAETQATGTANALRAIKNDFETNETQTQSDLAGIWEEK
ncbi:hypothetical protein LPW41_00940 [Microbacterium sp. JC 701]|jgi:hypothetical protein|uniref:hypothetical protein n=1 Tax=unclassified Microbacterium TaxID=2609290 RepID=UPI0011A01E37|nr:MULTISPECIES: hypothetical protein [unclassified Microbacterium]MCD2168256.1 hypothetical protein [Microbacterium sp. JC 701]